MRLLAFYKSENIAVDTFVVREYSPLVNIRAHMLSKDKSNILNN
jgi:hypothetical protein